MLPLQGLPVGRRDAARSGLRSIPARNGSAGICAGCYQAHAPMSSGPARLDGKILGAESQLLLGEKVNRADQEDTEILP